jgi:hypothetical protein
MYNRFQQDRANAPGPRLSESEFAQQVRDIEAAIEQELAGEPFYKKYLEYQRRIRDLAQNPLKPGQKPGQSVNERS